MERARRRGRRRGASAAAAEIEVDMAAIIGPAPGSTPSEAWESPEPTVRVLRAFSGALQVPRRYGADPSWHAVPHHLRSGRGPGLVLLLRRQCRRARHGAWLRARRRGHKA